MDQLFSRLATWLKDKCILSVQWLLHACMKCCYDVSEAVVLDHFANFRDSVQPFLDKSFKDFASVRLWKFSAVKGEPEVQVKKNELNAQWTDLQGRTDKSVQILIPDFKLDSTFYAAAHRTFKAYEQIPTTDRCEEKDEYKASKNVKQMMVSLSNCLDRMKRVVRSPTEAYMRKILKDVADDMKEAVVAGHYEEAVASVRDDIKEYSLYRTFPFDWNVGIYTNPETISLLDLVNG